MVHQRDTARRLGVSACTALVVGNMIGSGIFLLPASLAFYGPISIFAWVATSVGAIALAILFGRLSRLVPGTGGPYIYTSAGFGEFPGFLIAWGYWIALWAGNAGVAVAFTGYLAHFVPAASGGPVALVVALSVLWSVALVNMYGVGFAGAVQVGATLLKLLPLLALLVVGVANVDMSRLSPVNPTGMEPLSAIAACCALTLWAFLGLESATVPAEAVEDPGRTIPLATLVGTCFVASIYILITIVAFGTVPLAELSASTAPLAVVAERLWGTPGAAIIAGGAIVSTFGTLNGFTLLAGQVPYGAARNGVFPKVLAKTTKAGAPANALIASSLLSTILITLNFQRGLVEQFTFIILLATMTSLVPYLFCALVELVLYATKPLEYLPPDRLDYLVALSAVAFLFSMGAIYGSGSGIVFWGFLLLMSGLPVFVWIKHTNPEKVPLENRVGSVAPAQPSRRA